MGGMNVSEVDPEQLLSLYSIVFQDVTLFNNTIMENIRIGKKDATDEDGIAAPVTAYSEKADTLDAVFEDFDEISSYLCDDDGNSMACDVLDEEFPIREYLVPTLMELVVKELTSAKYQPVDDKNNANDDMSKVSTKQS